MNDNMDEDLNIESYFDRIKEQANVFQIIREKKQIFDLPPKIKSNLSDLLDVVQKLRDINKLVNKCFEDKRLTPLEIKSITDQLMVTQMIVTVILEDQQEYYESVYLLDQFYAQLIKTVVVFNYVIDIHRVTLTSYYDSNKKEGWIIDESNFLNLAEFLNEKFVLTDYNSSVVQNEFDKIIYHIILILAFIDERLTFNVAYIEKTFLLEQFYLYQKKFYDFGHLFKIMDQKSYYTDILPSMIENLDFLREKVVKSKDQMVGITSWGATREELTKLIDLLKDF